jgi:hypothetical protein
VPITQTRMQNVLAECQMLTAHLETLRGDAENIVASSLAAEHKVRLLLALLHEARPSTPHSDSERQHFARATKRNVAQAKRMQRLRQRQKENENGLD